MAVFSDLKNGTLLGGGYVLGDLIRQEATGAVFNGSAAGGQHVLIKLVAESDPEAQAQYRAWERMRTLDHPHLQRLSDLGVATPYLYAVLELPDDLLAPALDGGPLSEAETRAVLEAGLAGLGELHGHGLVHGAVDANHVIAVADTIKLATDGVRLSDDADARGGDFGQLEKLVRQLRAPEPLQPALEAMLLDTVAKPRAKTAPLRPPAEPVRRIPVEPPSGDFAEPSGGGWQTKWVIAAVAVIAVGVLWVVWSLWPESGRVKPSRQEAGRTSPKPAEIESRPAAPAVEVSPVAAPNSTRAPEHPPAADGPRRGDWRVIAFTYRSHEIAARKAEQINHRWPGLGAGVFEPKDGKGFVLVSLGDWMKRAEAEELQRKARGMGLPRDIYVQNYHQ
jgi:hypothetical protein